MIRTTLDNRNKKSASERSAVGRTAAARKPIRPNCEPLTHQTTNFNTIATLSGYSDKAMILMRP
jgi:hypothetical protein